MNHCFNPEIYSNIVYGSFSVLGLSVLLLLILVCGFVKDQKNKT